MSSILSEGRYQCLECPRKRKGWKPYPIIHDKVTADVICTGCGECLVARMIDRRPEWRLEGSDVNELTVMKSARASFFPNKCLNGITNIGMRAKSPSVVYYRPKNAASSSSSSSSSSSTSSSSPSSPSSSSSKKESKDMTKRLQKAHDSLQDSKQDRILLSNLASINSMSSALGLDRESSVVVSFCSSLFKVSYFVLSGHVYSSSKHGAILSTWVF